MPLLRPFSRAGNPRVSINLCHRAPQSGFQVFRQGQQLSERLLRGCKDGLCDRVHLTLSSGAEDGEVVAVVSKEVGGEEERGARGGVPGHEH